MLETEWRVQERVYCVNVEGGEVGMNASRERETIREGEKERVNALSLSKTTSSGRNRIKSRTSFIM